MFLNELLIIFASIALFLIKDMSRPDRLKSKSSKYIYMMGVFVFIWTLGYGVMGITVDFNLAQIFRVFGLVGIEGFLMTELFFVTEKANIHKNAVIGIHLISTILLVLDAVFFGSPGVDSFVRINNRTGYYANDVWQRDFHNVYIGIMTLTLLLMWITWRKKAIFKREKRYLSYIFATNITLLVGCIPDTFLPLMGIQSWPSSAIGGFISYLLIRYINYRYADFEITDENVYRYIYDYADIGLLVFQLDYRLIGINKSAGRLVGIEKIDTKVMLEDLFEISKEDAEKTFEETMQYGRTARYLFTKEKHVSTMLDIRIEKDENGYDYAYFASVIDQTKEDMRTEQLSIADKSRSQFLTNMSHAIRTPVNTILGMNEIILRDSNEPKIREFASNIKNSCNLLISIINDILDFSKIESGEININESEYSLSTLIGDLVRLIEDMTTKKGLKLNVVVDESLPERLCGDEVRVRQIITNLLTNAVKYTDYGEITLKFGAEKRISDSIWLKIEVVDTGKGIQKEDQQKLFKAFSRVDEKRNRHIEGTGLGLSISSQFVKLMGGTISVKSEYGKGSDFIVVIPQGIIDSESVGDYSNRYYLYAEKLRNQRTVVAPNARTLIVDDNEMNLNVAKLILFPTQMSIDLALGGAEALDLIRKNKYDLILLDHMMPEIDGIDVLNIMKQEDIKKDTPVVVLTANAVAGAKEMYIDNGFDDYLSKPIVSEELFDILVKYLPSNLIKEEEVSE